MRLNEDNAKLRAEQEKLTAELEKVSSELGRRDELEQVRQERDAANAENERMAAEMQYKQEIGKLEAEVARLRRELELNQVKQIRTDTPMEEILKIYAAYKTEESREAILSQFGKAVYAMLKMDTADVLTIMQDPEIGTAENCNTLRGLARRYRREDIISGLNSL